MADFTDAFQRTMGHEGGYVHDAADAGGETYKGVSRRYNPTWPGWKRIDAARTTRGFPRNLEKDATLQGQVRDFYKQHFWDKFWGDSIPEQSIADELFDSAVNLGVNRAVDFLQRALNALNRNEALYKDLVVDGVFGRKSLAALRSYLKKDKPGYLLKIMNVLQGMHYIDYMTRSPLQEKYARGWFNRVEINVA